MRAPLLALVLPGARVSVTQEELEAIGGELVSASWRLPRGAFAALLLLFAFATLMAFGIAVMAREEGPLWLSARSLSEKIHYGSVSCGYLFVWCMGASQLALHLWRPLASSPAFVAGTRGVRVHGLAPTPRLLPWQAVEGVKSLGASAVQLELVGQQQGCLHKLIGGFMTPLQAFVAAGSAPELAGQLELLRQAGHAGSAAGMPYPESPREDPA